MFDWAPLVYGRTFAADYRTDLIACPEDFDESLRTWATGFIQATTLNPSQLHGRPRWSVFQDHRHRVVGITCMGSMVATNDIKDEHGREVYVFLGWVCQTPFAPLPPMDLTYFKSLYDHVRDRWREKPYEKDRLFPKPYVPLPEPPAIPVAATTRHLLSYDDDWVQLWPTENADILWRAAGNSTKPLSLCIGVAMECDAEAGPFQNVVLAGSTLSKRIPVKKISLSGLASSSPRRQEKHAPVSPPSPSSIAMESESTREPTRQDTCRKTGCSHLLTVVKGMIRVEG